MYRRGLILGLGVIALLMGFAATSARADGKRVALVVGNSAYRNVPELPNPANDAGDVATALNRLGFSVTLIANASFEEMRRGLIALGREAAGADMAVMYFAGHGMEMSGENWLIPIDAELKKDIDAENEAISLRSVMLQVSNTTSLGLVVLDACPTIHSLRRCIERWRCARQLSEASGVSSRQRAGRVCRARRHHRSRR
jgi:hypothetical protein